jgi:hypothetical protein
LGGGLDVALSRYHLSPHSPDVVGVCLLAEQRIQAPRDFNRDAPRRQHALCYERQLQRPDEPGDDQQVRHTEYEMEYQFTPRMVILDEKGLGGTGQNFNDH